jgi:hypothetical protein
VEVVHIQLFGQLAGIDPVTLLPFLEVFFRLWHAGTSRLGASASHTARPPSFFEGDAQISAQSINELQKGAGLGLDGTHDQDLADRVPHGNRNTFPCTSLAIYLVLVIQGCSFLEKFEQGTQNVLQRAPSLAHSTPA